MKSTNIKVGETYLVDPSMSRDRQISYTHGKDRPIYVEVHKSQSRYNDNIKVSISKKYKSAGIVHKEAGTYYEHFYILAEYLIPITKTELYEIF